MNNMQTFSGTVTPSITKRVAIVTGAAGGIGQAIIRQLALQGHTVAAVDINNDSLQHFVGELRDLDLDVHAYVANISSSTDVDEVIHSVESTLGPIYYLVNAAGILRTGKVTEILEEDWKSTMDVNVYGSFLVSRAVARSMIARGDKGSIVTIASNAASTARIEMGAYAASKAAVVAFTKCLGLELAEYGIRCNIVAPGSTDTDMLGTYTGEADRTQASIDGVPEAYRVGIPLQRVAQPSHVADAVMFLLSEMAGHITMETLTIDGGATLGA